MITYLIFGLLFILVVLFSVLTAKNWHWINIVLLVLIYIVGVAASFGAASSLIKRREAKADLTAQTDALEKAQAELSVARFGLPNSVKYDDDSLYGVEESLKLQLAGRGRVWMNGTISEANNNRKFSFPVARDSANPEIGKLNNSVVHAFLDAKFGELMYPSRYVGTFRVVDEKAESLELEPQLILNNEVYSVAGTWTLFEKMPTDQHDVFSREKADGSGEMSLTEFRDKLTAEYLPPETVGMVGGSEKYEKFIDQFLFDGQPIGEIENWVETAEGRISRVFAPEPEEVFVRYRFNKKSNRKYKVDAQGNLETDGGYTLLGEAIDPALHLGYEVEFAPDDEVLIDLPTSNGYQRNDQTQIAEFKQIEDVTEINRFYKRQIYDFPSMFADLRLQRDVMSKQTVEMTRQNEAQEKTLKDTNDQIAMRDDILAKLQQDNDNLQKDVATITALLTQRKDELAIMRQEMADLERKINAQRSGRSGNPMPNP